MCSMLTACSPTIYYQLYQTKPTSQDIKIYENKMVYEDDNCSIMYDFWEEYGNIGFMIYNKSSENLYLHLDQCFYINNGYAYDYYQNRIYNNKVIELSELSQNTTHSVSHIETLLTDVSDIYKMVAAQNTQNWTVINEIKPDGTRMNPNEVFALLRPIIDEKIETKSR